MEPTHDEQAAEDAAANEVADAFFDTVREQHDAAEQARWNAFAAGVNA